MKYIAPAARRVVEHRDPALAEKANKIFDEPSSLDAKAKANVKAAKAAEEVGLESLYDADELDD